MKNRLVGLAPLPHSTFAFSAAATTDLKFIALVPTLVKIFSS